MLPNPGIDLQRRIAALYQQSGYHVQQSRWLLDEDRNQLTEVDVVATTFSPAFERVAIEAKDATQAVTATTCRRGPDPVEDGLRRAHVAALDRVEQGAHQAAAATDSPLVAEAWVALHEALELLLEDLVDR